MPVGSWDASRKLADRPWPDVGRPTVLLPLGSVEQHGPHLPLDTDTVIAEAVTERLAARMRETRIDVVVSPSVTYGASGEHEGFPGTVSVGHEALEHLLVEYGRSMSKWAARLTMVNAHGGNLQALDAATRQLRLEGRDVTWVPCVPDFASFSDAHAGRVETSLLLHLDPGRVQFDRAEVGETRSMAELLPVLRRGGVAAVAPNGVLGDPRGASATEGERLLASMVEEAWRRVQEAADART